MQSHLSLVLLIEVPSQFVFVEDVLNEWDEFQCKTLLFSDVYGS